MNLIRIKINQKWLVLLAIGMSTFMSALDTSVVNTVLPVITESFQSHIATVEWVVIIYLLIVSGLLLTFGRLGDIRGHRPVFLLGFSIFILSSALCGLAQKIELLILFRGMQAFGAAMLAANSPAILTKSFPSSQRGQALGLQATMTYLGLTVAPSLGGWLTDFFSWRAVFYINIPVGLFAFALAWIFIPTDGVTNKREPFDSLGAVLFLAGLVSLLLALNQGYAWGWFSPLILGFIFSAIILLLLFVHIERRKNNPLLDLSLFGNRVFSFSIVSAVLNYIAVFSILLLMPFYLLQGLGFTPSQAGVILTVQPIVMALVAPISGSISDRVGTRIPSVLGMLVLTIGLVLMSRLNPTSTVVHIGFVLAIVGLGTGTFISPNNSAIMGAAPRERQGIAAGLLATARSTGMVLGVGIAGAIFTTITATSGESNSLFVAFSVSLLVSAAFAALGAIFAAVKK